MYGNRTKPWTDLRLKIYGVGGEEEIGRITYLGFLVAGFFSSKRSASARVGNLLNGIVPDRETTPIWSFANAITILLGTKLAIGHKAPMVDRS